MGLGSRVVVGLAVGGVSSWWFAGLGREGGCRRDSGVR